MKVKVTIDLADKAQAAAFQNLVSAQAAAAQDTKYVPGRDIEISENITFSEKHWQPEVTKVDFDLVEGPAVLHDEQMPAEAKQAMAEYNAEPIKEKKTRAPRKAQATEEQPADTAAAENLEVNEPEEVKSRFEKAIDSAANEEIIHDEKPNNPVEYTEQEVRQLVADKVNAHRPVIVAKLNALGSKSVTLLPKEKYGELVAFLNGLD